MGLTERFRDPELGKRIVARIRARVGREGGRPLKIMEVCGTHTMAISRAGIRDLLRGCVRLVSGPGCPVCVTDEADLDRMIALARLPGVIITTFGDMVRVPGSHSYLLLEKSRGAEVRVVYSPLDAVEVAEENPGKKVVFLGVGFETTVPVVALALEEARERRVNNFLVYSAHKLVPPALEALLSDPEIEIDAFLYPGHVSTVLGRQAYEGLHTRYRVPAAIAGFEPLDILQAIDLLVDEVKAGRGGVLNAYPRAVREEGNPYAREAITRCFQPADAPWRGLGVIPASGLQVREEFSAHDAARQLPVEVPPPRRARGCSCGEVLKGKIEPPQCLLFGGACTPANPVGPCMVSGEGACAAYYHYERRGS